MDFLLELQELLESRKTDPSPDSYTSGLFSQGKDRILRKIGEEAGEVIIAAKNKREELIPESADLLFHLLVLLVHEGISWEEIIEELKRRRISKP